MDFVDQLKALSVRIPEIIEHVTNEGVTRSALVEPFIRALGYDPSYPKEVLPEFGANVDVPGTIKDKRVDYAIFQDGKPIILIECKHHSCKLELGYAQLYAYYTPTDARIGILTNGLVYRFYADLEKPGVMDKKPFLEMDMQGFQPFLAAELKRLVKTSFDIDGAIAAATELKFTRGIKTLLKKQLAEPDDQFVKFFFDELCPENKFTGKLKENFKQLAPRAFRDFIRDEIDQLLNEATIRQETRQEEAKVEEQVSEIAEEQGKIETTAEELEGFYIVKSMLHGTIPLEQVEYRDKQGYFNILLEGKNNKPLCRFYFNNPAAKKIGLFDKGGGNANEEKINISSLNDLFQYADRIKATPPLYLKA